VRERSPSWRRRESIAYARARKAFGKPLIGLPGDPPQAGRHGHPAGRGARAGRGGDRRHLRGDNVPGLCGDGEERATDMLMFAVVDAAVQLHGGYGLHARDAGRAAVA
jgi:hypothetical protein